MTPGASSSVGEDQVGIPPTGAQDEQSRHLRARDRFPLPDRILISSDLRPDRRGPAELPGLNRLSDSGEVVVRGRRVQRLDGFQERKRYDGVCDGQSSQSSVRTESAPRYRRIVDDSSRRGILPTPPNRN